MELWLLLLAYLLFMTSLGVGVVTGQGIYIVIAIILALLGYFYIKSKGL